METQNNNPMFKQIAMLLIQADKCVKEGNLPAALDKIAEARTHDPAHLYALAYEERVKALLHSRQKEEALHAVARDNSMHPPVAQTSNGHSAKVPLSTVSNVPSQQVASVIPLAEQPKKASVENGQKQIAAIEQSTRHNFEKNIAAILSQAYHYFLRKEYNRALDEIARIYLLSPAHERAHSLETSIRSAIREQNIERSMPKSEMHPVQEVEKKPEQSSGDDQRRTAIAKKVSEIIGRVSTFAEQKHYKRALDELTRGYILDPHNPQLKMLEDKIRDEEDKCNQQHRPVVQTPVGTAVVKENGKDHDKNAKVAHCFIRANDLLRVNKLEDALNELALAVIIDPFNEEAIKMEKTIIDAQHRQLEERRKTCKEIAAMIAA
ncbi:MAG: hypothetical protein HYV29_16290 [Ignavibacteriales bacterium]|nr:hypothetical protein [Ignavibacteriales bacterium]